MKYGHTGFLWGEITDTDWEEKIPAYRSGKEERFPNKATPCLGKMFQFSSFKENVD